ncbi:MAG: cadmium-containing carbonic anhydrase [Nannocystaceae bacterium]|nr:cadmium-containing carbonic anhydrase [bacterium]
MSPQDIVEALEGRGWKAKVLKQSDLAQPSVKVDDAGLFKCVDGRKSDHSAMNGPKTLGGVYALVAARKQRDLGSLKEAVDEVKKAGFAPSVHGDEGSHEMGCGFFKLWSTGQLDDLDPPEYSAKEGREAVQDAGGAYETLEGKHSESCVLINLVEGTTYEPQNDQSFVVDAWITSTFDLDVPAYLTRAAETVEKLDGPKVAKIIVAG